MTARAASTRTSCRRITVGDRYGPGTRPDTFRWLSSEATVGVRPRTYAPIADISSGVMSIIASISGPPVRLKRQTRTAARARKMRLSTVV